MYSDQGGKTYDIETNVGEYITVHLPPQPKRSEILFSHLKKEDQYWVRTELPELRSMDIEWWSGDQPEDPHEIVDWDTARREEIIKQTGGDPWNLDSQNNPRKVKGVDPDPDYYIDALENFRTQEYERVDNGIWFMNNGVPTYITGYYYFFLNWWKIDIGYAQFRIPDMELFYLVDYVRTSPVINPTTLGFIYIAPRGCGKSVQASAICYLETITKRQAYVGIQSKTELDAENFFKRKVVTSYQDLPDFWIPINKNPSSPTNSLDFSAPSKSGKTSSFDRKKQSSALRSVLDFKSSDEIGYDGETLSFKYDDEVGKTKEADVYRRWEVNKECVVRDGRRRGWSFQTTTVEEMESGGGANCERLWNDSNQYERDANGQTKTGLIRYFRSVLNARNFDKYGYPNTEGNKVRVQNKKLSLENDPNAYIEFVQKNPETIKEAFAMSTGDCCYNAAILQRQQMKLISPEYNPTVQGDFEWIEKDKSVKFVPNPENGMWEVSWLDIENGCNNVKIVGHTKDMNGHPLTLKDIARNRYRSMAYDPTSAKKVIDKTKQSDAAATVYQATHDMMRIDAEYLDTYIADFCGRYPNPDDANEQVLMAAVFFGAYVLIEDNKDQAIKYFQNRGYEKILIITMSGKTPKIGISGSNKTIDYYVSLTRSYIIEHGHKLKHVRIVRDWLGFDPTKTTKFDTGVASSYNLIAAENTVTEVEEVKISVTDYFNTYNQSGSWSKSQ